MFTVLFEASTTHIRPETAKWLDDNHEESYLYDKLPRGFLFYITDHEDLLSDKSMHPELHELIHGVLKSSPGCSHLLLVTDGQKHDWLRTFNW